MQTKLRLTVLTLILALQLSGQTRTEELLGRSAEYQKQLTPERNTGAEKALRKIQDDSLLQRINYGFNGLGTKLGGMVTGGGFGVGPQYLRTDLRDGTINVGASAQISTRNYRRADANFALPKLFDGKAMLDVRATYRDYRGIQYYGPGPDSLKNRTNYKLEDTALDAAFALTPLRFVKVGGAGGVLNVNVGPGKDSRFASSDATFTPAQAPGIGDQTDFLRYGAFGHVDWRDDPFAPKNGGSYLVQYMRYEDNDLKRHDFSLLEIDLQQYVGIFNRTRVFALRAHTRLTDTRQGQTVPFYLQPIVGGSDDLRGFRPFRFSDNNSLVLSGEYRWAIFSGCDGALFVDAGKVFPRRGQLNFNDLEGSAGFGLRFNARNRTFMRVDVGFSHEGVQVWFKFNDMFQHRPLGTADSQPIL